MNRVWLGFSLFGVTCFWSKRRPRLLYVLFTVTTVWHMRLLMLMMPMMRRRMGMEMRGYEDDAEDCDRDHATCHRNRHDMTCFMLLVPRAQDPVKLSFHPSSCKSRGCKVLPLIWFYPSETRAPNVLGSIPHVRWPERSLRRWSGHGAHGAREFKR